MDPLIGALVGSVVLDFDAGTDCLMHEVVAGAGIKCLIQGCLYQILPVIGFFVLPVRVLRIYL